MLSLHWDGQIRYKHSAKQDIIPVEQSTFVHSCMTMVAFTASKRNHLPIFTSYVLKPLI